MGKKKSVVLMVLLTIVIVALCVITAFPVFTLPGTEGIKSWNPAVMQFDLGSELDGGHYAYYYPEGVIPETEYDILTEEQQSDYVQYGESGLYLSTDMEKGILKADKLTLRDDFVENFNAAKDEICARFAAKGYVDYSVSVVDGCALRIELPTEETETNTEYTSLQYANQAFTLFAVTGDIGLEIGGEAVKLDGEEVHANKLIKSIKAKTQYNKVAYLEIVFTKAGQKVLKQFQSDVTAGTTDANGTAISTLDLTLGGESMMQITPDLIADDSVVKYSIAEAGDKRYVETLAILLNSAMENGGYDIEFTVSEARTFEAVYRGNNTLYFVFGAVGAMILALIVFAIVKMGRFGVVNAYASLSYIVITLLCFAFITSGSFPISAGSVFIFLFGLILVNVFQYLIYNAIKKEFSLGKTVDSSVKGGYKKTLWLTIDVYAVLLLAALALLIGAAGLQIFAIQAIICVIAAAFCSLLWARGINFVFLSASKNKYKYFRFVREDDDDE